MQNALQASATERILKQVYTGYPEQNPNLYLILTFLNKKSYL